MSVSLHCSSCGYDLRGTDPETGKVVNCPECGTENDLEEVEASRLQAIARAKHVLIQLLFMPMLLACLFPPMGCLGIAIANDYMGVFWVIFGFLAPAALGTWFAHSRARRFQNGLRAQGRLAGAAWVIRSFPACWVLFSLVEIGLTVGYVVGCILVVSRG